MLVKLFFFFFLKLKFDEKFSYARADPTLAKSNGDKGGIGTNLLPAIAGEERKDDSIGETVQEKVEFSSSQILGCTKEGDQNQKQDSVQFGNRVCSQFFIIFSEF